MVNIAICDDEMVFNETLLAICTAYFRQRNLPVSVDTFTNGADLLEMISNGGKNYRILFLDILMGKENGVDLAADIRKANTDIIIVFITSSPEFAIKGYSVQAFDYLLKPLREENFKALLDRIFASQLATLTIRQQGKVIQLMILDILFCETAGRKCLIATRTANIAVTQSIAQLERQLPAQDFFRCHQSYLVNLNAIRQINLQDIELTNQSRVLLARSRRKQLMTLFMKRKGSRK